MLGTVQLSKLAHFCAKFVFLISLKLLLEFILIHHTYLWIYIYIDVSRLIISNDKSVKFVNSQYYKRFNKIERKRHRNSVHAIREK